ncbi:MAG: RluA family pseudouridine synthase [Candidatus Shikimatogenerans sp. Tder]|uniref:Pseudouridine synthase n=1 Tax=Candidatus Shikimatogenerans sp. Tder TaxID=3158566 RepID=A0AAU7QRS1_9FLAO
MDMGLIPINSIKMKKCKFCYLNFLSIRIDKFLSYIYKISRNKIIFLIKNKNILINNKYIKKNYFLKKKDIIIILKNNFIYKYKILPKKKKLNILYEDDYLLVINKKYNLVVNPTLYNYKDTLINYLLYKYNNLFLLKKYNMGLINRLDKDTSGIILIAKNFKVLLHIQNQFKTHKIIKKYFIIINGIFKKKRLCIKNNICRSKKNKFKMTISNNRGKYSITFLKRIKILNNFTLLKCYLKTGRTHQIRVHLNSINYNILNDKVYYNKHNKININKNNFLNRQALHSYYIKFFHPIYKKYIQIYCKLPNDIKIFINKYKYL